MFGQAGLPTQRGMEMSKGHHLHNSLQTATPYKTACGRTFDPMAMTELLQAMMDQQWTRALNRTLREDEEYIAAIREHGGAAQHVEDMINNGKFQSDEEFLEKLKPVLLEEVHTSLVMCAIQDAYIKIRKKRDEHQTNVAAEGSDPYESLKSRRPSFGDTNVNKMYQGGKNMTY